ncbi:hypothetical protein PAMA_020732 [Pampus argenteus]
MLIMLAERWLYTLALCFMCVSSNDESFYDHCETQTVSARLGSSVLLPCNFRKSSPDWVSWIQTPEMHLVNLTSEGRIKFLDPRHGRAKAFPNQGSEGNYSICIDELQSSDLGIYRCEQGHNCLQVAVQLLDNKGALSEEMQLLLYICVGVAAFILLSACGYCCKKHTLLCKDTTQYDVNNPVGAGTEGEQNVHQYIHLL